MKNPSFTTTIAVDQTPEEAFAAINNVSGWWSGEIEGSAAKLGDEFTYRYQDVHRSKQKVMEFIPGRKIVWHVLDSQLSFVEDKSEWNGTDIVFDISRKDGKTEIRFTHAGLVPQIRVLRQLLERMGNTRQWQFAQVDRHGKRSAGPVCLRNGKKTRVAIRESRIANLE